MSEHVQTVQAIYGAFAQGDVPGILAHLAEDVAWDQDTPSWGLPWYEPRTGRDQVPAFLEALRANVELARFEPVNFLAGGNQVAAVISISLVVKGRRVDDLELHLWTFGDDGKVTRFAHVLDRHAQVAAWRGIDP